MTDVREALRPDKHTVYDVCNSTARGILLNHTCNTPYVESFVRYMYRWMICVPLKCVVIGQSPYSHDEFPLVSSAFAYSGDDVPPSVAVIAHDLSITQSVPVVDTVERFKNGGALLERGVVMVNASTGTHPGTVQSFKEAEAVCVALAMLASFSRSTVEDQSTYVLTVVCLGQDAKKMGKLLCSYASNIGIKTKKHEAAHPAYYAREWGSLPYSQLNTMRSVGMSKALAEFIVKSDYVDYWHSVIDMPASSSSSRGGKIDNANMELLRSLAKYATQMGKNAEASTKELTLISESMNTLASTAPNAEMAEYSRSLGRLVYACAVEYRRHADTVLSLTSGMNVNVTNQGSSTVLSSVVGSAHATKPPQPSPLSQTGAHVSVVAPVQAQAPKPRVSFKDKLAGRGGTSIVSVAPVAPSPSTTTLPSPVETSVLTAPTGEVKDKESLPLSTTTLVDAPGAQGGKGDDASSVATVTTTEGKPPRMTFEEKMRARRGVTSGSSVSSISSRVIKSTPPVIPPLAEPPVGHSYGAHLVTPTAPAASTTTTASDSDMGSLSSAFKKRLSLGQRMSMAGNVVTPIVRATPVMQAPAPVASMSSVKVDEPKDTSTTFDNTVKATGGTGSALDRIPIYVPPSSARKGKKKIT